MAPPEEPKVEPVDDLMDMNTVTMPEPAPVEQTPVDMTVDVQQPVAEQPQVPEQPEDLMGDLLGGVSAEPAAPVAPAPAEASPADDMGDLLGMGVRAARSGRRSGACESCDGPR